jgi:Cof subfamily protein (haloacid dehalogenase superfamily)
MKRYLIALDLDGTLLFDWKTISPNTINYLKQLNKQGHEIVIATGRPFRSSEAFHKALGLTSPIINYNGALITSKNDKDFPIVNVTIPKEWVIRLFEENQTIIQNAFGEVQDDIYLFEDTEEIRPLLHYFNGASLTTGPFRDILHEDPNGFLIICHEGKAPLLEEYVSTTFKGDLFARNWGSRYNYVIEIYTPITNKGKALKHVADYLGFDRQSIIAFGDAHNDIDMLQFAGLGVAMKNASEDLKLHADDITSFDNTEDGIVHYLKEFFEKQSG